MKRITALMLSAIMALSLVACGGGSTQPAGTKAPEAKASEPAKQDQKKDESKKDEGKKEETKKAEPVTLRVAYMPNYASLWGVMSAIKTGAFEKENIKIELWEFADGPSEVAAMEGGSIDLAYIGKGAHKLPIRGRAKIFAPSSVHTTDSIVVSAASGINSIEDLKGKKVAYNSGSSSEATLNSALTQAKLKREDLKLFDMDVSYMVSAMVSGTVDAAIAWNPYTSEILKQLKGSKEIKFSNGSINMSSWICLPAFAKEHHDVLVRFTRALFEGMDYGSKPENYKQVAEWCAEQSKTSVESNLAQTGDAEWFSKKMIADDLKDGKMKGYYEHVQEDFLKGGAIKPEEKTDVNNFVLFDVMKEALEAK